MPLRTNPYEKFTLNNLAQGLAGGLDPSFAQSIFTNTVDSARARMQQQRDTVLGLQQLAMQQATAGVPEGVAGDFVGSVEQNYPFLSRDNPFAERSRESIQNALSGLYPGAGGDSLSPVHTAPSVFAAGLQQGVGQAAQVQLDAQDLASIEQEVAAAAAASASGQTVEGRHETWAKIMARLNVLGVDAVQRAKISNFIGQVWDAAGGPPPPGEVTGGGAASPQPAPPAAGMPSGAARVSQAFSETPLGVFPAIGRFLTQPRDWLPG